MVASCAQYPLDEHDLDAKDIARLLRALGAGSKHAKPKTLYGFASAATAISSPPLARIR